MDAQTFEQIKELIEISSAKGGFDYLSLVLTSFSTLLAVWFGFFLYTKHAEKIITEKDIERLYEAGGCFFEFSDAVGLFFSMVQKEVENTLQKDQHDSYDLEFNDKVKKATNAVYDNFRQVNKAYFLLKALGEDEVAKRIDLYKNEALQLRKAYFGLMKTFKADKNPAPLEAFYNDLPAKRDALIVSKDACLDDIAKCNKKFKATAK